MIVPLFLLQYLLYTFQHPFFSLKYQPINIQRLFVLRIFLFRDTHLYSYRLNRLWRFGYIVVSLFYPLFPGAITECLSHLYTDSIAYYHIPCQVFFIFFYKNYDSMNFVNLSTEDCFNIPVGLKYFTISNFFTPVNFAISE